MLNIANEVVSVPLAGGVVSGLLFGNEELWSFECSDGAFLALFPAGVAYSFSEYGHGSEFAANRSFQNLVGNRMREILAARRMMDVS